MQKEDLSGSASKFPTPGRGRSAFKTSAASSLDSNDKVNILGSPQHFQHKPQRSLSRDMEYCGSKGVTSDEKEDSDNDSNLAYSIASVKRPGVLKHDSRSCDLESQHNKAPQNIRKIDKIGGAIIKFSTSIRSFTDKKNQEEEKGDAKIEKTLCFDEQYDKRSDHVKSLASTCSSLSTSNVFLLLFLQQMKNGMILQVPASFMNQFGGIILLMLLLICNVLTIWGMDEAAACLYGSMLCSKAGYSFAATGFVQTSSFRKIQFAQNLSLSSKYRKQFSRASMLWLLAEAIKLLIPLSAVSIAATQWADYNDAIDCIYFTQDTVPVDREFPTLDVEAGVAEYVFGTSLGIMRSEVSGVNVTTAMIPPVLIGPLNNGDKILGPGFSAEISTSCTCASEVSASAFVAAGVDESQANDVVDKFMQLNMSLGVTFGVTTGNGSVKISNTLSGVEICGGLRNNPLICSTIITNHLSIIVENEFMTDGTTASIAPNIITFVSVTSQANIESWLAFGMNAVVNGPVSFYSMLATVPGSLATLLWWTSPNLIAIDRSLIEAGIETMYAILFKAAIQRTYSTSAMSCPRKNTLNSMQSSVTLLYLGYVSCNIFLSIQLVLCVLSFASFGVWFLSPSPIGPAVRAAKEPIYSAALLSSSCNIGNGIESLCNAETYAIWQVLDVKCKVGESLDTLDDETGKIVVDKLSLENFPQTLRRATRLQIASRTSLASSSLNRIFSAASLHLMSVLAPKSLLLSLALSADAAAASASAVSSSWHSAPAPNTSQVATSAPVLARAPSLTARPPKWSTQMSLTVPLYRRALDSTKTSVRYTRSLLSFLPVAVPEAASITPVTFPLRQDVYLPGMDSSHMQGVCSAEWVVHGPAVDAEWRRKRGLKSAPPDDFTATHESLNLDDEEKVILYFHGGGYFSGSPATTRNLTCLFSQYSGCRVLAASYRLAPEYPFPTPLYDAISSYLYLIDPPAGSGARKFKPEQIVLAGDSAGGGLAIALALWIRDNGFARGLRKPAGIVALAPWLDLTHSQPSFHLNSLDYLPVSVCDPAHITRGRSHYYTRSDSQNLNPYVSPLFGHDSESDFSSQLPPTLIQLGSRERLRDEGLMFAASSFRHSPVTVEMFEDMVHVFQTFASGGEPVAVDAFKRIGKFVRRLPSVKVSGDGRMQEVARGPRGKFFCVTAGGEEEFDADGALRIIAAAGAELQTQRIGHENSDDSSRAGSAGVHLAE
ncbi:hypothetical protein HDU83_004907 [Entophlyctis luteolus]|nr:hypothetical protein HDU83_004907 [Entophlyctis luteolus]